MTVPSPVSGPPGSHFPPGIQSGRRWLRQCVSDGNLHSKEGRGFDPAFEVGEPPFKLILGKGELLDWVKEPEAVNSCLELKEGVPRRLWNLRI